MPGLIASHTLDADAAEARPLSDEETAQFALIAGQHPRSLGIASLRAALAYLRPIGVTDLAVGTQSAQCAHRAPS